MTTEQEIMDKVVEYIVESDANNNLLEGGKNYKLHLPQNIPTNDFWSVIVYDNLTHLIIRNDQSWPSVFSSSKKLVVNQDESVDIYFSSKVPTGKATNWIKTIPGKGWHMILRLYYPLDSLFDKAWRPGEIEEVK